MMKIKKAPSQFVVFLLGSYSTLYTLIQCLQLISLFTNTCNLGAPENWCFWTMVLEKNLESPLDYKEIQPIHPKGDRSWVFIGRTDVKAETPILWSLDAKSWLTWKDPDAGKDWGQKGTTEDEMVGWHHRLNGHGFGWTLGVGDGQGGLACCDSWGHKESDMTEQLSWTELMQSLMWVTLTKVKIEA